MKLQSQSYLHRVLNIISHLFQFIVHILWTLPMGGGWEVVSHQGQFLCITVWMVISFQIYPKQLVLNAVRMAYGMSLWTIANVSI